MSSTGRRAERLGGPEDFFVTPSWPVRRLLEAVPLPSGLWVEPGAGSGHIIRAVNDVRRDVEWMAIEIREQERANLEATGAAVYIDDFVNDRAGPGLDVKVVLGNPPFLFAKKFIDRALLIAPHGWVVMLLRTNFAGSKKRVDFMREFAPDLNQIPERPSFFLGKTDSVEYSWFVWGPGGQRRRLVGAFRVLASTPKAERLRDRPQVGKCPSCGALGWRAEDGRAVKKRDPAAFRPCAGCLGFGKIKTGPSKQEIEWGMAA